jgi:hypothetical protein
LNSAYNLGIPKMPGTCALDGSACARAKRKAARSKAQMKYLLENMALLLRI